MQNQLCSSARHAAISQVRSDNSKVLPGNGKKSGSAHHISSFGALSFRMAASSTNDSRTKGLSSRAYPRERSAPVNFQWTSHHLQRCDGTKVSSFARVSLEALLPPGCCCNMENGWRTLSGFAVTSLRSSGSSALNSAARACGLLIGDQSMK